MSGTVFFVYRFDRNARHLLRILGVRIDRDGVRIDGERLIASFGPLNTTTDLANVKSAIVTGPYKWYRAIGPRLSVADRGLTFGTTAAGGVCIEFNQPLVRVIGPWDHPGLTVTVAEPEQLVEALTKDR